MKKKAIISVLATICLIFSSCGLIYFGDGETTEVDTSTADSTAYETEKEPDVSDTGDIKDTAAESTDKKEDLPKEPESIAKKAKDRLATLLNYDFKKQSFIIATTSEMTFSTDGDTYYERVLLLRDSLVEEKYNTDIITIYAEESKLEDELRNAALAEDYYADLLSVPEFRIGRLAKAGLIMNLRSLPFYGTMSSYSDFSDEAVAGNAIYADIGAASSDFTKIYAVFFNRPAAESLGHDLDEMVADGEWTWDAFDRLARKANEKFGMVGQGTVAMGDEYTDVVFRSANIDLVNNTLGQVPVIEFDADPLENAIELACSLIYGNPSAHKPGSSADFYELFREGKLLFAIAPISAAAEFSKSGFSWGILPIPKYEYEQERYYAYTEASANLLAVPSENNKLEMTSIMIGALNAASFELLAEEFKTACLYDYFGDIKAMNSMDAVLSSITFDYTYLYSSWADKLASASHSAVREARKSTNDYASHLINARSGDANRQLAEIFGEKYFPETPFPQIPNDENNETTDTEFADTEALTDQTETEAVSTDALTEQIETEAVSTEAVTEETETEKNH